MNAGWILGAVVAVVMSFAGLCQTGLFRSSQEESPPRVVTSHSKGDELFNTEAGWRYQRGQPNHWKYLMMKR